MITKPPHGQFKSTGNDLMISAEVKIYNKIYFLCYILYKSEGFQEFIVDPKGLLYDQDEVNERLSGNLCDLELIF